MTAMKITLLLSALFIFLGQALAAEPFRDDFTQKELKQRRVKTGEWTIGNGVATCAHDDADLSPIPLSKEPRRNPTKPRRRRSAA